MSEHRIECYIQGTLYTSYRKEWKKPPVSIIFFDWKRGEAWVKFDVYDAWGVRQPYHMLPRQKDNSLLWDGVKEDPLYSLCTLEGMDKKLLERELNLLMEDACQNQ